MEDMDLENRIVSTGLTETDTDIENSLRPKTLEDYIGQDKVKENLAVYIEAARTRGEALQGSRAAVRSARIGQDHAGGHYCQ
mgnify:CR=1 FL=1